MPTGDIYAAIDIGSSALRLIKAVEQDNGMIEIKDMLSRPTQNVTDGSITDTRHITVELTNLLQNTHLSSVNVHYCHSSLLGMSNPNPAMLRIRGRIDVDDIIRGIEESSDWLNKSTSHREYYPNSFTIDNTLITKHPIGELASTLAIDYHLLTLDKDVANNIAMSTKNAGLEIVNHCIGLRATAEFLISEQQKNHGVVIVDIGHELIKVMAYYKGNIIVSFAFSIGGVSIEDKIKHYYNCSKAEAIKLKQEYGFVDNNAKDEDVIISYTAMDGQKYLSTYDLSLVITGVYQHIFDTIIKKLKIYNIPYTSFRSGIILVGGNAQIPYLRPFAIGVFKTAVSIANISEQLLLQKHIKTTTTHLHKLTHSSEYLHVLCALMTVKDSGFRHTRAYYEHAKQGGKMKKIWNNLFKSNNLA